MRAAPRVNPLYVIALGSLVVLAALSYTLVREREASPAVELTLFCAAGMRKPVERIASEYREAYGVRVQLQYGGSNTLLNQIEVGKSGDLYLAADDSYTRLARDKGLVEEELPIALMRPVIAVQQGNPKNIRTVTDLHRSDVRVAMGNPDQAAIGKKTRRLLGDSGHWSDVEKHTRETGVFKPTVPEVANDVKVGSVDAGIIWDAVCNQYPDLEAVRTPELDAGASNITVGVITTSKHPTASLRFARYLAAADRGLRTFKALGYEPIEGDAWADVPQLTFFAGSVNRKALEPVIKTFAAREGVEINTIYNGCGILTGQMRSIKLNAQSGFPDMYMACDVYYLDTVRDWFQDAVNVSNTDIVIVVQEGNPKNIQGLSDLAREGTRVAVGQPDQCTIGVLTRRLLEAEGVYKTLFERNNIVTETATSALLVPTITTGAADAALAYTTDARAEADKVDVVPIDSPMAKAVQPFSIARTSDYKHLGRRMFKAIAASGDTFESAGFVWRLDTDEHRARASSPATAPAQGERE
jgi:molybdenum ABC transporter molybdate-binding protein